MRAVSRQYYLTQVNQKSLHVHASNAFMFDNLDLNIKLLLLAAAI